MSATLAFDAPLPASYFEAAKLRSAVYAKGC